MGGGAGGLEAQDKNLNARKRAVLQAGTRVEGGGRGKEGGGRREEREGSKGSKWGRSFLSSGPEPLPGSCQTSRL